MRVSPRAGPSVVDCGPTSRRSRRAPRRRSRLSGKDVGCGEDGRIVDKMPTPCVTSPLTKPRVQGIWTHPIEIAQE